MARNLSTLFHMEAAAHPQNLALIYCTDEHCERRITYSELQVEAGKVSKILLEGDNHCEAQLSQLRTVPVREKQTEVFSETAFKQYTRDENDCADMQSVVCEYSSSWGVEENQTTIIGILCSSGPEAVACILGILEKDAYFYIAPECTKTELKELLRRVCPKRILAEENYIENFDEVSSVVVGSINVFEKRFKLVSLNNEKESAFQKIHVMKELAYVIPTSGSTGIPKYVYVPHCCILPNITDLVTLFGVGPEDCIFCAAPLTFDPSVVDLFMAFKVGARLVMVSPQILKTPRLLLDTMIRNKVTVLQATPTLMLSFGKDRLQESLLTKNSPLKVLALGGEVFPKLSLIKQWMSKKCKTRIFNLYGITEVSCWASAAEIVVVESTPSPKQLTTGTDESKAQGSSEEKLSLPKSTFTDMTTVGNALTSTVMKVLNKNGEEVEEGEEGEIFIGGCKRICWVDNGTLFLNNEECSHIKPREVQKVLRPTGDRGVIINGKVYCIGRLDCQVKRNGQKVSLAEIESVCQSCNYVDACRVVLDNKSRIIAFVFSHMQGTSKEMLLRDLRRNLSEWKLPDNIVVMKEVPFNKHGKIDVKQLLSTKFQSSILNCSNCSHQSLETYFKDLWKRVLRCTNVNSNDNFIKCGGNSLNAVQFAEELGIFLGYEIPNLLDVLLNENFLKTYQLVRKYNHSRKSIENFGSSNSRTQKKFKREYPERQSSQAAHTKETELYKLHSEIASTHSQEISRNFDFLHSDDPVTKDRTTKLTVVSRRGICNNGTIPPKYDTIPYRVELLWKYNLSKCIDSSPVVVEYDDIMTFICVGSHSYKFACINAVTGIEIWCLVLGGRIESSPILSKDGTCVYVGCYDGCVYCTCIETGCIIWKYKTGGEVKSSPIVDDETGAVIFGSHDKKLYCLSSDGELIWTVKVSEGSIFSSPSLTGDSVYVATLDGTVSGVNKMTGSINWRTSVNKPVFSSLAQYSKGIIFGNVCGEILGYSFSGYRLWKFETKGNVFSSPFVLQLEWMEVIGIGCHDHSVYFLNETGEKIAEYTGSSPIYATPFLFSLDDHKAFRAVICETSGKFCIVQIMLQDSIDANSSNSTVKLPGALVETVLESKLGGELFASPIFYRNKLYIGCRDDFLYGFNLCS